MLSGREEPGLQSITAPLFHPLTSVLLSGVTQQQDLTERGAQQTPNPAVMLSDMGVH